MREYPLQRPQNDFCLFDEPPPILRTDPGVAGDAQQRQAHLEGQASANGAKSTLAVGEVTGIFPEEVTDKRFGGIFVARALQEKVLEFSGDAPDIKHTIRPLHPFQVDPDDAQPLLKEEVRGSGVTVNENLLIFPHPWLFAPALTQPGELLDLVPGNELPFGELAHEAVEVGAIFVKIHSIAVRRPIMKGGQEICQSGKLAIEPFRLLPMKSIGDDTAQRLAATILLNQQTIQPTVVAKRTYNVMGVSYQSISAHQVEIVKFLFHALIFCLETRTIIAISREELSYHLYMTIFLFIEVHVIAPTHAKDAKFHMLMIQSHLWQYIIA